MRISIWQQWASNHSAWYTVVGAFSNPETAAAAADEIRSVLRKIQDYWQHVKPEGHHDWDNETLSPPEEAIKRHYNIDWTPVNWFDRVQQGAELVSVVDRFVLFSNPIADTRIGPRPVTYLLERLGAELAIFCEGSFTDPDSTLFGQVTFVAPDEPMAVEVDQTLRRYFETASHEPIARKDTRQFSEDTTDKATYRWYEVLLSDPGEASVQRDGLRLTIQHLRLMDVTQIEIFVTDVISWLKHQHCSNIEISFSSESDSQGG